MIKGNKSVYERTELSKALDTYTATREAQLKSGITSEQYEFDHGNVFQHIVKTQRLMMNRTNFTNAGKQSSINHTNNNAPRPNPNPKRQPTVGESAHAATVAHDKLVERGATRAAKKVYPPSTATTKTHAGSTWYLVNAATNLYSTMQTTGNTLTRPITAADGVKTWVDNPGDANQYVYMATKSPGPSKSESYHCTLCGHYGHVKNRCMHVPTAVSKSA